MTLTYFVTPWAYFQKTMQYWKKRKVKNTVFVKDKLNKTQRLPRTPCVKSVKTENGYTEWKFYGMF